MVNGAYVIEDVVDSDGNLVHGKPTVRRDVCVWVGEGFGRVERQGSMSLLNRNVALKS